MLTGDAWTRRGAGNRAAAELAAEQHGPLSRPQLVALGWSETTIDRRLADGLLTLLWPGVYAYGHGVLTPDGWLMAATLAGGPGTHLVARAAASARGLLPSWSTIDIAPPVRRGGELPGLRIHRVDLRPQELDRHRGLPITTLARTALDVAATERPDRVGQLLDRALLDGFYDHAEMVELLAARRGCRGVAVLRAEVAKLGDTGVVFRSRAERLGRDVLLGLPIPQPIVNAWFPTRGGHGYELDLWFPGLRLDLEIDGPHHAMPRQMRLDALRDADLRTFGVRVVRVPSTMVTDTPDLFATTVLRAVSVGSAPHVWG